MAKRCGTASKATCTSSSRVAASDCCAMRATLPGKPSPFRNRMRATWPGCTRPTTDSSTRVATHSDFGSTIFNSGVPGTTVLPASAKRWITTPSIGATMRAYESTASA